MRIVLRILAWLFVLLIVVVGIEIVASESGEVVVVTTRDSAGGTHETRLWVVDEDDRSFLRAGNPQSGWLLNIQQNPAIEVERDDEKATFIAVPDAASRDRINALFLAKYGWADRYIGMLFGRDDATPIRLDPSSR